MRPLHCPLLWLFLCMLLVAFAVFASLTPHPQELPVHYGDKAEYATLSGWFGAIYTRPRYLRLALLLITLGIGLEFDKAFLGRDCQFGDMVVDGVGVGVAGGLSLAMTPMGSEFVWLESIPDRLKP